MKDRTKTKVCRKIVQLFADYEAPPPEALTILATVTTVVVTMLTDDPKKRVKIVDAVAKAIKTELA